MWDVTGQDKQLSVMFRVGIVGGYWRGLEREQKRSCSHWYLGRVLATAGINEIQLPSREHIRVAKVIYHQVSCGSACSLRLYRLLGTLGEVPEVTLHKAPNLGSSYEYLSIWEQRGRKRETSPS